jgi:hypothetical protein
MLVRRFLRPFLYFKPADDEGGDLPGGTTDAAPADDAAGAADAAPAPAPAPSTMDAINAAIADVSAAVTPAPKPAAEAPAPEGEAAAPVADQAKPADPAAEATKPAGPSDDELTAPLEGLKGRTKERFEQLAGRLKERTAEIEALVQERDTLKAQAEALPDAQQAVQTLQELHGAMTDAQVSGEEFAGFLTYAKQVRSGDFQAAAQTLIAQLRPLLPYVHGKVDLAGALDPLADFADLQEAVATHQIAREHAAEIAQGRRIRQQQEQALQQRSQATQQTQQQTQAQQQATQQGLSQLQALERNLASQDADYSRIAPELVKAIPQITKAYPPHLWASAVQDRYQLLKTYLPQQQRAAAPAAPAPAPLRPGGSGGAGIPAKLDTRSIVDMVTSGELT